MRRAGGYFRPAASRSGQHQRYPATANVAATPSRRA